MADNYIPQIDYTSRDYASIREDLLDLIQYFAPEWTNRDPADFGITLLEAFAFMGDNIHYYIDRAANEGFITTSSQRDNVLQLARLLGYQATDNTASSVTLTFQNSLTDPIVVPALTRVATSNVVSSNSTQIIFETNAAVTVPGKASGGTITVKATQGETVSNEFVGTSTGEVNQIFELKKSPVIDRSINITVGNTKYTQVPYLIDYNNSDPVFTTYTNSENTTYVIFGDNISGRVPPVNSEITATYRIGGGAIGNVGANTIAHIITNGQSGLTVKNQYIDATDSGVALGGADRESTAAVRVNAPASLRSLDRAVATADYSALTVKGGAAKAVAVADVYTSVTVYMVPFGDKGVTNDGATASGTFNNLKTVINAFLVDKIPANTSVTFQPASYVKTLITASITCLPQYKQSTIQAEVNAALDTLFNIDNVVFADRISINDVTSTINSIEGVAFVELEKLIRTDEDVTKVVDQKTLSAGGVATLRTTAVHGLKIGDTVKVTSIDGDFNGIYVVQTVPSTTTFTYAAIGTAVSATAVIGGAVTLLKITDILCDLNEIPEKDAWTLTLSGGITI